MKITKSLTGASILLYTEPDNFIRANCVAIAGISDIVQTLKLAGSETEYTVTSCSSASVICNNVKTEFGVKIDVDFLKKVCRFALEFDPIEVSFGDTECILKCFSEIVPVSIDLNGVWRFDATKHSDAIKRMFPELELN